MTGYGDGELSDARIAAMSPAARRDLIQRLQRPLDEVFPPPIARRMRHPPANYVAHNWPATWIGFDCLLIAFMAVTAVLGWLRRQLVLLPAFATGVLLICDAWFDIMTAGPGQLWISVLTAALLNLPLAAIMIAGAVRIIRLTATRLWFLDPATPAWRLPLVP